MNKIRHVLMLVGMLVALPSSAVDVSIGVGLPNASIGVNFSDYPDFEVVPNYPVYYAPGQNANLFFYDGLYWVYQNDNWYSSDWYDGPWWLESPEDVPLFVLRVPVRYYPQPPVFFLGWQTSAPPRWGDHWGRDWEQRRHGWDRWDRNSAPKAAPLPLYQRQYSGDHYPRQVEQQHELQQQHYGYKPRDPEVKQREREHLSPRLSNQQDNHELDNRHSRDQDTRRHDDQGNSPRQPDAKNPQQQGHPEENRKSPDNIRMDSRDQTPQKTQTQAPKLQQGQRVESRDQGVKPAENIAPPRPQPQPRIEHVERPAIAPVQQERPQVQERRQQQTPPPVQQQQQMPPPQGHEQRQQDRNSSRESKPGQQQEHGRDHKD